MVMATRELEQALTDAGIPQEDAQRVADAHAAQFDNLATKDDLANAIAATNVRIDDLRDSLRHEMDRLREDMNARFRMLYVFISIASGAIIALLSALIAISA